MRSARVALPWWGLHNGRMIRLRTPLASPPVPFRARSPVATLVVPALLAALALPIPALGQSGVADEADARGTPLDTPPGAGRGGGRGATGESGRPGTGRAAGAGPAASGQPASGSPAAALPAALPGAPWSAEVAVAGRGAQEQDEAQRIALRAVLLANAGDKTLLNRDEVREGLRRAERYVERFDYRTPPPGTVIARGTPLTETVRRTGEATQLMLVRFDRERLEALMARDPADEATPEAGEGEALAPDPFANLDRALVWLLIEDGRRDIMISDPAARNIRERAREIAGARGLALVYPVGDEEDRQILGVDELREERLAPLQDASERYAVPVVLAGRLGRDGLSAWQGSWTRFAGERVERERFDTDSLDEALQAGLGWLSEASGGEDRYRYGGSADSDAEALVWIGPLDSIAAYATVMDFLQAIPGVGTVYPKEVDERGMAFTVVPRGALPAIASAASSENWLRRTTPPREPLERVARRGGWAAVASGGSDPRFGGGVPEEGVGGGIGGGVGEGGRAGADRARGESGDGSRSGGSSFFGGAGSAGSGQAGRGRPARDIRPLAGNADLAFEYLR